MRFIAQRYAFALLLALPIDCFAPVPYDCTAGEYRIYLTQQIDAQKAKVLAKLRKENPGLMDIRFVPGKSLTHEDKLEAQVVFNDGSVVLGGHIDFSVGDNVFKSYDFVNRGARDKGLNRLLKLEVLRRNPSVKNVVHELTETNLSAFVVALCTGQNSKSVRDVVGVHDENPQLQEIFRNQIIAEVNRIKDQTAGKEYRDRIVAAFSESVPGVRTGMLAGFEKVNDIRIIIDREGDVRVEADVQRSQPDPTIPLQIYIDDYYSSPERKVELLPDGTLK